MPPSRSNTRYTSTLIGGAAFIFACRVVGAALTFATQILLARWMGASELGVYLFAFSWCLVLTTFSGLGLSFAAIRFIGQSASLSDSATIRRYLVRGRQIITGAGILFAVVATIVFYGFPPGGDEFRFTVLASAMIAVPFFALLRFHTGSANALSQLGLSFVPDNIARPSLFLLVVATIWILHGRLDAESVMQGHALVIVTISVVMFLLFRNVMKRLGPTDDKPAATRQWLRTSIPLLIMDLSGNYFPELTVIIVSTYLPSDDVGVYAISFRTAMLIMFGLYAVDAFMAPKISGLLAKNDRIALVREVNHATKVRFWGAMSGAVVLLAFGRQILALFGPEFVEGYESLAFFVVALIVGAGVGPVVRILSVSGHHDHCMIALTISVLIAAGLITLLTPIYGISGAAAGASVGMTCGFLMMRYLVVRHLEINPRFL